MIKKYFLCAVIFWLNSYSQFSYAALSANTAHFIIGSAPQFNAQLEQEIAQHRFSLLKFNYLEQTYPNNQTMPLVDPLQTVQQFTQQVTLSPIILNEDDTVDIDGDGDMFTTFISGSVTVLDKNNQPLNPSSTFCENIDNAPMTLQLSAQLHLSSRYGVPNTTPYNVNHQYTLAFKPTICYLKPSLIRGDRGYAGVWNQEQGFLYDKSKTTFPTTGMDGLNYDIKLLGANVLKEQINRIYSTIGNVYLTLSPVDSQTLNVKLGGPTANNPKPFQPTLFHILIGPVVYEFNINQWFIHNNDQSLMWAQANNWCNQLGGGQRYQLPTVTQLSNGKIATNSVGPAQHYTRAIGEGILAEWGSLVSYGLMTNGYIWSGTKTPNNGYYDAHNASGSISTPTLTFQEKAMCVSK